jgi:hypothetical protein
VNTGIAVSTRDPTVRDKGFTKMGQHTLLATAVLPLALLLSPQAHAAAHKFTMYVSWSGSDCASVTVPLDRGDPPYYLTTDNLCLKDRGYYVGGQTQTGLMFGARISLAPGLTHVECQTYLDDQLLAADRADASQGSGQADCLRVVP